MFKHIHIRGFKSLADVSVDLEPVTVFIGRSSTGKTNFLTAIRFVRDFVRSGDAAVNSHGGWDQIRPLTEPAGETTFAVTFQVAGIADAYDYSFGWHWPKGKSAQFHERLALGGQVLFEHRDNAWVVKPDAVETPRPQGVGLRTVTGVPDVTVAYLVLGNGVGCYDFPGDVLRYADGDGRPDVEGLADQADNYLLVAKGIVSNLQALGYWPEITAALGQLDSSVRALTFHVQTGGEFVVEHAGPRPFRIPLTAESEGLRRYLAHLLALYQSPPKQVLVFEEPEKGIYAGALEGMAGQFRRCADMGRGQVLLTSHSPELLEHYRPEEVRVVEMEDRVTRIRPVGRGQVAAVREQLLRPG